MHCLKIPDEYNCLLCFSKDTTRMVDAEMLLCIYRTGDYAALSEELSELHHNMLQFSKARPELSLKIATIRHLQILGMTYKKNILQQLSIMVLCSETNWQFQVALKEAVLVMEEILP